MVTNIKPNAQQPSINSELFLPDQLIAGDAKIVTDNASITGGADLVRGSVLGQITVGAISAAALGGNLGNGTIGSLVRGLKAGVGVYALVCVSLFRAGTFDVFDPAGVNIGTGKVGTAFSAGGLGFTLADGAVNFAAGDEIDMAIALGAGSSAPKGGNTGNGAMGAVTPSAPAKAGVYKLTIVEPGANAGIFTVTDPDGIELATGTVGVAYNNGGLAFTLADGATDFISGDQFDITVAAGAESTTPKAGNVGNGVMGVVTVGGGARSGTYRLVMNNSTTDGATFSVVNPNGRRLADALAGVAYSDPELAFQITEGGTLFSLGDGFNITIAAGSGKYKLAAAASIDGSQNPCAILADDAAASAGDVNAGIYLTGEFNSRFVTFGAGITLAAAQLALRPYNTFLKTTVSAAPES